MTLNSLPIHCHTDGSINKNGPNKILKCFTSSENNHKYPLTIYRRAVKLRIIVQSQKSAIYRNEETKSLK